MSERKRVQKFFTKPSLTRQEFKNDCDLGLILKRFQQSPEGQSALRNAQGFAPGAVFDDVSMVPDYRAAFDVINSARAKFEALPEVVRRRFNDDPALFMNFMADPRNLDEARSLGLCKSVLQDAAKAPVLNESEKLK